MGGRVRCGRGKAEMGVRAPDFTPAQQELRIQAFEKGPCQNGSVDPLIKING